MEYIDNDDEASSEGEYEMINIDHVYKFHYKLCKFDCNDISQRITNLYIDFKNSRRKLVNIESDLYEFQDNPNLAIMTILNSTLSISILNKILISVDINEYYDIIILHLANIINKDYDYDIVDWMLEFSNLDPFMYDNVIFKLLAYENCYYQPQNAKKFINFINKYNYDINMRICDKIYLSTSISNGYIIDMIFEYDDDKLWYESETLELLINNGADINLLMEEKKKLLLLQGDEKSVSLALNNGFNPHLMNYDMKKCNQLLSYNLTEVKLWLVAPKECH